MLESDPSSVNEDVWVIVPCYNEATVVRAVIEDLMDRFPNVVVVDDGSTDDSAREVRTTKARLVQHPINLGAGAAYQTGIDFALRDPRAEFFVTFDADGQHSVADAVAMVRHLRGAETEVLIGSRFLGSTDGMTFSRKCLLKVAVVFERLTSGITLTDAHQGLRVFRRSFASVLDLRSHDMSWASEFLTRMAEHHASYAEFPVHIRYSAYSRAKGQRSINSVNIGLDVLVDKFLRGH